MAVKSTVSSKAAKSKKKSKASVNVAKPSGLQATAAQWAAYQKAYTAAYQNTRINNSARALRASRAVAANKAIQAYSSARRKAQAASTAAFASQMTAQQAAGGNQNAALRARVNENLRQHLSVLSKAQYAEASSRTYMQKAVQRTQTEGQARTYEEKAYSASSRIAASTSVTRQLKTSIKYAVTSSSTKNATAGAKASTTAKRGRTSIHATSAHQTSKANRSARTGQRRQSGVRQSTTRLQVTSAKSTKAVVATYKTRAAPKRATDEDVKELLGIDPWESIILDPGPRPIRFDWLGDETTPDCVVTAVANSCLLMTGIRLDEEELQRLRRASLMQQSPLGLYPLGIRILSTLIAARSGEFSSRVRLENAWPALMSEPFTPGMVIGYDTPNGPHAALLLPDHRVATWGGEEPLTAPIDEAWVLKWTT